MTETAIVELREEGTLTLPESVRQDLPAGTRFLVHRQESDIILSALQPESPGPYDLSSQASCFANELIAEEYEEYLLGIALTDAGQG
jgi:hypothetical protein